MGFFSSVIHDSRRQINRGGSTQSLSSVEPRSDSEPIEQSGSKALQTSHQPLVDGDPTHFKTHTHQQNPQHTSAAVSLSANQFGYPHDAQSTSEISASTASNKKAIAVPENSKVTSENFATIRHKQNLPNSVSIEEKAEEQKADVVLAKQDTSEHLSHGSEKTTLTANIEKVSITNSVTGQAIGEQSLNQNDNGLVGNQEQGAIESKPQLSANAKVTPTESSLENTQQAPVVEQLLANGFDLARPDHAETFVPSSIHPHSNIASPPPAKPTSPNINIGQVNVIVEAVDTQVTSSVKAPVAHDNSSRVFLRSL